MPSGFGDRYESVSQFLWLNIVLNNFFSLKMIETTYRRQVSCPPKPLHWYRPTSIVLPFNAECQLARVFGVTRPRIDPQANAPEFDTLPTAIWAGDKFDWHVS